MLDSLWLNWLCRLLIVLVQLVGCWSSSSMLHDDGARLQLVTQHAAADPALWSDCWDLSSRWRGICILSSEQLHLRIGCRLTAESKFDRFIPAMAEGRGMGVADKGVEEGGNLCGV